jgi:hypothetical protein
MILGWLVAGAALALGVDYGGNCEVGWSDNVQALVSDCVLHYAVNATETFWLADDTDDVNASLRVWAALDHDLEIVLNAGTAKVRTPFEADARDLDADWRVAVTRTCKRRGGCRATTIRVDLWTGNLDLDALKLPETADVRLAPEALLRLLGDQAP